MRFVIFLIENSFKGWVFVCSIDESVIDFKIRATDSAARIRKTSISKGNIAQADGVNSFFSF